MQLRIYNVSMPVIISVGTIRLMRLEPLDAPPASAVDTPKHWGALKIDFKTTVLRTIGNYLATRRLASPGAC